MLTRRGFLRTTGTAGLAATAAFTDSGLARMQAAGHRVAAQRTASVAADETYWREIQQAFTLDRTIINLNNGGCCPSPRVVHEALKRYLDISNQAPVYHMWQILEPNIESVRRRLAAEFGCDPEELAITRNASEALQIAQLGIELKPGDEVVTTNQDYGRMLDTWEQRVRRDGIKLTKISFPVPPKSTGRPRRSADRRDHAGDEGPALLPHHQPHRPDLSGQADLRRGAAARRQDRRRRRARVRALSVQGERSRLRLLRDEPPQVAARADRHGLPLRAPREHRVAVAADAGQRRQSERHPQIRGDRHAPGGESQCDRRSADVPRGHRHRTQGGPPALPARSLGETPDRRTRRSGCTRTSTRRSRARSAPYRFQACRRRRSWHACGNDGASSPRRSCTPNTKAPAITPNVYTTLEEIDTFAAAMEEICARARTRRAQAEARIS